MSMEMSRPSIFSRTNALLSSRCFSSKNRQTLMLKYGETMNQYMIGPSNDNALFVIFLRPDKNQLTVVQSSFEGNPRYRTH